MPDHSFGCRRATVALRLVRPYLIKEIEGEIFWLYVSELVELINGGLYMGLPHGWLEVPHAIAEFDWNVASELRDKPRIIFKEEILPSYQKALKAALNGCYRTLNAVDLSENNLMFHGLEPDPRIDYDEY
jgi:hypothetical protein